MQCECTAPEEWRAVVGYEGLYEVSSFGRIRRLNRDPRCRPFKILKPYPQWHGYLLIKLYRLDVKEGRTVHGLVAAAFIGPRPPGADINHIDADKTNNRPENLEYVTRRENLAHADERGLTRRGMLNGQAKLTEDDVRAIRSAPSTRGMKSVLAQRYGVSHSVIRNVLSRKTWRHVIP